MVTYFKHWTTSSIHAEWDLESLDGDYDDTPDDSPGGRGERYCVTCNIWFSVQRGEHYHIVELDLVRPLA